MKYLYTFRSAISFALTRLLVFRSAVSVAIWYLYSKAVSVAKLGTCIPPQFLLRPSITCILFHHCYYSHPFSIHRKKDKITFKNLSNKKTTKFRCRQSTQPEKICYFSLLHPPFYYILLVSLFLPPYPLRLTSPPSVSFFPYPPVPL